MATRFPSFSGCSSASIAMTTCGRSIPLMGGRSSLEPIATIRVSGSNCFTYSGVTSVFITTLAPDFRRRFERVMRSLRISSLKKAAPAGARLPPSSSLFSTSVTSCPLLASVMAASIPAGPPPAISTLLTSFAAGIPALASSCCPMVGFTEHFTDSCLTVSAKHS